MKKTALIDSGPLIALFDGSDRHHRRVVDFLKGYEGRLLTSWPVLTEVSHMLDFNLAVQLDFLKWIERGGVEVAAIEAEEIGAIRRYMQKYLNVPMDLADASLIHLAEREGIGDIVAVDRDFFIYRTRKKVMLNNLLIG